MAATVTAIFANPDPSANPTSVAAFVTLLNSLSQTVNVEGGPFTPYVISSTTPQVSDQDKIWAKVDGNGRPLGLFLFYNGNWRRFYNGNTSETKIFKGNPATFFDNTGLGLVGLDWDGWALCNGQNGTDDLSDQFIISGHLNDLSTGYSGGQWKTSVTGASLQTGGSASYALINSNLPYMPVFVTGKKYSSGAANSPKRVLVDGDYSASGPENTDPNPIAQFGANPSGTPPVAQVPVPTLPPFFTRAYVDWVGYS